MFNLSKRSATPPRTPREIEIPDDRVREVLVLLDRERSSGMACFVARYDLWTLIKSIVPEFQEGAWKLDTRDIRHLKLIEVLPVEG
ncbi:MAG TPA: hypothetical protein VN436_04170 [Holophaga sp.]|nr:hypothetical protein [Holophaga sp.]